MGSPASSSLSPAGSCEDGSIEPQFARQDKAQQTTGEVRAPDNNADRPEADNQLIASSDQQEYVEDSAGEAKDTPTTSEDQESQRVAPLDADKSKREEQGQTSKDSHKDTEEETRSKAEDKTEDKIEDKTEDKAENKTEKEEKPKTGIGRLNKKDNVFIDEAEWEDLEDKTDLSKYFYVVIRKDGQLDKLQILSDYLKKVFRSVVSYFPEVALDNESISFKYPYAPLFFYMQEMIDFANEDKDPDVKPEAMTSLRLFYDKWVRQDHEKVRDTLGDGLISFNNLWALFKPGEFVYTIDEFGQPALYMTAASVYRLGAEQLISDVFKQLMGFQHPTGRFVIDVWRIEWDGSTRTFSRKSKTMVINIFSGTRSISSLEIYPLSHYKNGDKEQISQLLSTLRDRGMEWHRLLTEQPSCWFHAGPAKEVYPGLFQMVIKEKTNVGISIHTRP